MTEKHDFNCCLGKTKDNWCSTCLEESENPEHLDSWCFNCEVLTKKDFDPGCLSCV